MDNRNWCEIFIGPATVRILKFQEKISVHNPKLSFWQILNFVMTVGNYDPRKSRPNKLTWNKIWFVDRPMLIYNDWHLEWFNLNLFISAISISKSGVSLSVTSIRGLHFRYGWIVCISRGHNCFLLGLSENWLLETISLLAQVYCKAIPDKTVILP